jgi:hypothetical protein
MLHGSDRFENAPDVNGRYTNWFVVYHTERTMCPYVDG